MFKMSSDGQFVWLSSVRLRSITTTTGGRLETQTDPDGDGKKIISQIYNSNGDCFETENRYNDKKLLIYSKDYRGRIEEKQYDAWGNETQSEQYPDGRKNMLENIVCKKGYGNNGDYLRDEYDTRGVDRSDLTDLRTQYLLNESDNSINYKTQANNQRIYYGYTGTGNLQSIHTTVSDILNENDFGYTKEYLTRLTHNGTTINFEYDGYGNETSVKVGGTEIFSASYSYTDGNDTKTLEYANGDEIKTEYDKYGRHKYTYVNGVKQLEYIYKNDDNTDNSGAKLKQSIDSLANITYNYEYEADGQVKKITYSGAHSGSMECERDLIADKLTKARYTVDGAMQEYTFGYETNASGKEYPDNKKNKVVMTGGFTSAVEQDVLGRIKKQSLTDGALELEESYTYLNGGYPDECNNLQLKQSTTFIASAARKRGGTQETVYYSYDKNGNITKISRGNKEIRYTYDAVNRLTEEENEELQKRTVYTYDAGGNITQKVEYPLSGGTGTTIAYTYAASGWKDQLTSYNGEAVSYDAVGNPLTYRGATLTWVRGRLLNTYSKNGATINYSYDANGIRTQKVENGITHKYYAMENNILREERVSASGTDSLVFYYGMNGIAGFGLKRAGESAYTRYYYAKNVQGDIESIYDVQGNKVAEYAYDAWGQHIVKASVSGIAELNPYRYRGYYYDTETGLYYLQTRYYDPVVCRFINADDISYLDPEAINGLNLYAYCGNNPVMNVDPSGTFILPLFLICLGVGLIAGAVTGGITAYNDGYRGWDLVGKIALGGLTGAALGAAVGLVAGMGTAAIIGGLSSVAGKFISDVSASAISQSWAFGSWEDYAVAFIFGGLLKRVKMSKIIKVAMDIVIRPLINQIVKMGTRGNSFNAGNYAWTVFSRSITYGFNFGKFTTTLFGQEFSIALGKSIFRGLFSGLWKKFN